ncbi:PSD1 and planctomycete cytochrome C domain-containing protein [Lentisphaera profundi]|uniref:PSD1 and planctomycete cytochrome C domain-containing protein n=1 Tax=Lentisphaera profundi TaxID=1658616 RepID=A0ABY7VRB8_9BACT|nr:PSD1 and planctomycete cytochrome C domain-containing protein [Lentisphaera profundi]WDE95768.1 PSD1 and planctomycete cytochrome C domain-containing protein [Lentisphaera profundi]
MRIFKIILCLLALSLKVNALAASKVEFFETHIRPVLAESCYDCHNSLSKADGGKKKGGLALDWKNALLTGGDSGDTIIPGNSAESYLMTTIRHQEEDMEMPAKKPKLSDQVIANFAKWIDMGAPDPRLSPPTKKDLENAVPWELVRDKRARWWSFQPLKKTNPPIVHDPEWNQTLIDRFIYAKQKKVKLKALDLADPATLIRRAALILTGTPPAYQDVVRYESDPSPENYEAYLDQLLCSPRFGERWARHWMDWYRYAETHGSQEDPAIAHSQEYKKYLIRALNEDVSYKQLLQEHLAGDLLVEPRINKDLQINESAIGPAHFRMNIYGFGPTDAHGELVSSTDNQIDVLGKAMMGVTISCARCHNHKFDPISQADFFRVYGILTSNRIGNTLISTPEILNRNNKELSQLKRSIRSELVDFWLSEKPDFSAKALDLFTKPVEIKEDKQTKPSEDALLAKQKKLLEEALLTKKKEQKLYSLKHHPINALSLLNHKELNSELTKIKSALDQARISNEKLRKNASLYLDFRQAKQDENYFVEGNSSASKISPAGSFAIKHQGDELIQGVYSSGFFSHLLSEKHAALFSSQNFKVENKGLWVRSMGDLSSMKSMVRNYPLDHSPLHKTSILGNKQWAWNIGNSRMKYWNGEQMHLEVRTSGQAIIGTENHHQRSWFGISELIIAESKPKLIGASLVDLCDPRKIHNKKDLIQAYSKVLSHSLKGWKSQLSSDQEAQFIDAMIKTGILSNQVSTMPKSLQKLIKRYRELEMEIEIPRRAPGLIKGHVEDQKLMVRGDYRKPGEIIPRGFLEIFSRDIYQGPGGGRLELAQDMVSKNNTLKTRVLINRLWGYVFGRAIVSSTDNFGLLGKKPSHPELLDQLSLDFEKNGWSIKRTLKQMLMSRTFKLSSEARSKNLDLDLANKYFSYYTPRRLDAEAIKDSISFISKSPDRTINNPVKRLKLDPFLLSFDAPIPVSSISTRNSTNVPAQALLLMNSEFARNSASLWAKIISSNQALKTPEQQIREIYQQAYARPPRAQELAVCLNYLKEENLASLTLSILNSKEFIYVH